MNKTEWTDDLIERIRVLSDEGMSTSRIALELGDGWTKNMIIGKFRRLGIPLGRPRFVCSVADVSKPVEAASVSPPMELPRAAIPEPSRPVEVIAKKARRAPFTGYGQVDIPEGAAAAIFFLPANGCKWPDADPVTADFRMCGDARVPDSPYCACHAAMAVGSGTVAKRKATSPLNRRVA